MTDADETAANAPLVSLITPTEGRFTEICALADSISRSLEASGQTGPAPIEFIVIDSTPRPLDPEKIPAWDTRYMRLVQGTANVREKRNKGARAANGTWLAFVDSDCVVTSDYVRELLAAIAAGVADAYAGRIEFRGEENAVWKIIAETDLTSVETQSHGSEEIRWCATANMIVRKSLFERLGGFDETLPFRLGGDDVDFGLRLYEAGAALRSLPSVVVIHPKVHWSRFGAILPRAWRWGRIEYHLAVRHPGLARPMPPYAAASLLGVAAAIAFGVATTREPALITALPVWMVLSTAIHVAMDGAAGRRPFWARYAGRWVQAYYHLGAAREHLAARSFRFVWEGLILDGDLDAVYAHEPRETMARLIAAALTAVWGLMILAM